MKERTQVTIWAMVSSTLGLVSVIVPVFILSRKHYDSPLFPWVHSGIQGLSTLSILFLFFSGIGVGFACPKRPFLLGICSMAAFPLLAFFEMLTDSTSHNLWPIEFLMYGVISLAAVVGAYIGRTIHRWTHRI